MENRLCRSKAVSENGRMVPLHGIETMHMIRKGQLRCSRGLAFTAADEFYSLATR